MEINNHQTGDSTGFLLLITTTLAWLGRMINQLELFSTNYEKLIDFIKFGFECFAWGGAGMVGLITFIKFLQENGWVKKGKPKI